MGFIKGKNTRKKRSKEKQCEEQPSEHLGEQGEVVVLQEPGQRLLGFLTLVSKTDFCIKKKTFSDLQIKPSLVAVYSLTDTAYYETRDNLI